MVSPGSKKVRSETTSCMTVAVSHNEAKHDSTGSIQMIQLVQCFATHI